MAVKSKIMKGYTAAGVLLLGSFGILPWWMGGVVKAHLEHALEELKAQPGVEVSDYHYSRGWGTSSVKMSLGLMRNDIPFVLEIHHQMTHRPWTLLHAFAQGETKISLSGKASSFTLDLNPAQHQAQVQSIILKTKMGLSKALTIEGRTPFLRLADAAHQTVIRFDNAIFNAKIARNLENTTWAITSDSVYVDGMPLSWQGTKFKADGVLSQVQGVLGSKAHYALSEWRGYESQTGIFCYITEPNVLMTLDEDRMRVLDIKANRLAIDQDVYGSPKVVLQWNAETRSLKLAAEILSPEGKIALKGQGLLKRPWQWNQPRQWNRTMEATADLQIPTTVVDYWMQLLTRDQMLSVFKKNAIRREPTDKEVASLSHERIALWLHDNMVNVVDNEYQFKLGLGQGMIRFNQIPVRNLTLAMPDHKALLSQMSSVANHHGVEDRARGSEAASSHASNQFAELNEAQRAAYYAQPAPSDHTDRSPYVHPSQRASS